MKSTPRSRLRRGTVVLAALGVALPLGASPLSVMLPRFHPNWFAMLLVVSAMRIFALLAIGGAIALTLRRSALPHA